ncbi:hypothetical protein CRYUN_Cryun19dG0009300 [Craigia yunnanensis]
MMVVNLQHGGCLSFWLGIADSYFFRCIDYRVIKPLFTSISAHRNEHLVASLRSFRNELKAKEPQSERKRKKGSRKDNKPSASVVRIPDL